MTGWLWIPVLWLLLGAGLALTAGLRHRGRLSPEAARKLLHIGMGLPLLFLPGMFDDPAPVLLLLAGAGAGLFGLRLRKSRWADRLYGVGRETVGEFAYLLGIGALWSFSRGAAELYVPPLLVLMFADAAAALVGTRFGRRRYRTTTGVKSWEGSAAFFLLAFGLVLAGERTLSPGGWDHDVVMAAIIALLVTMMEGASWQGWDNLFVPVAVQTMLLLYRPLPVGDLWPRLGVAAGLFGFLQFWRHSTLLHQGGALGAALAGYFAFAFGGWSWLPAPMLFFLLYALTTRRPTGLRSRAQGVFAVLAVAGPGLLWAVLHWRTGIRDAFWAAQTAYVVQAACTLAARRPTGCPVAWWWIQGSLLSWLVVGVLPGILWAVLHGVPPAWEIMWLLQAAVLATLLFDAWQVRNSSPGGEGERWMRHAVLGILLSSGAWWWLGAY